MARLHNAWERVEEKRQAEANTHADSSSPAQGRAKMANPHRQQGGPTSVRPSDRRAAARFANR